MANSSVCCSQCHVVVYGLRTGKYDGWDLKLKKKKKKPLNLNYLIKKKWENVKKVKIVKIRYGREGVLRIHSFLLVVFVDRQRLSFLEYLEDNIILMIII